MEFRDDEVAYVNARSARCTSCGHLEAFHAVDEIGDICMIDECECWQPSYPAPPPAPGARYASTNRLWP